VSDRLLVAIIGSSDSGKSTTWNRLFDAKVNTGEYPRRLYFNGAQWVDLFLISGSPEEREIEFGDFLPDKVPHIVLCSAQYRDDVIETFDYFFSKGYEVFVQWLNPGHADSSTCEDRLNLRNYLLDKGATIQVRDGRADPVSRVKEIRQFILGWAKYRDLIGTDFPD